MMIARFAILAFLSTAGVATAQTCGAPGSGCDFEPFNPVMCGEDYACGYETPCHATGAGFNVDNDCCQAPQPSACTGENDPQICGSKSCPYNNLCIAELAGYTASQCAPAPPECGTNQGACSGEPSNPVKCGQGKVCPYDNQCIASANGFDPDDCCQDARQSTPCQGISAPLSCGAPGGKQCPYSNSCDAESAGYKPDTQCCPVVPEGLACTGAIVPPVACGPVPCLYVSQCEADGAGFSSSECCPQAVGACTMDINSVACGTNEPKCTYPSQSCADLAGYTSSECCVVPSDTSGCTMEINPVACGQVNCIYDNPCIAELAGFDPNSCVRTGTSSVADTNGTSSANDNKVNRVGRLAAVLGTMMAMAAGALA